VAYYRIIHWKQIPSLVEVFDGDQVVQRPLSPRFQDLIDAVAMREGASETDAYLEGWGKGPEVERPGAPSFVAEQVAAELEAGFQDLVAARLPPASRGRV
jgi:hypothetical protein